VEIFSVSFIFSFENLLKGISSSSRSAASAAAARCLFYDCCCGKKVPHAKNNGQSRSQLIVSELLWSNSHQPAAAASETTFHFSFNFTFFIAFLFH